MNHKLQLFLSGAVILILPWLCQCNVPEGPAIPYELGSPTEKHKLPKELVEISGLAYLKNDQLLTIQDERAEAFVYDLEDEKIKKKLDFGKDGDYEGIAFDGQDLYVVKTNGKIYTVENAWDKDKRDRYSVQTKLSHKNNPEGLAVVPGKPELLVACKGKAGDAPEHVMQRAIYSYDISSRTLHAEPKYIIDLEVLNKKIIEQYPQSVLQNMASARGLEEIFRPSGIAVHPITKDVYIISTAGKLLVVLGQGGNIKMVKKLNRDVFKQPEGICFEPDGDLYISNEGRSGKGNILFFKYLQ